MAAGYTMIEGQNPFSDYTGIVFGERFVGRAGPLLDIQQKIVTAEFPGCISIVGQKRIGKSSLAWHSLLNVKGKLHERRTMPVWLPVGECREPGEFFTMMLRRLQNQMTEGGFFNPLLDRTYRAALQVSGSWVEFDEECTNYFIQVRSLGWKPVFVLDEFDSARNLFQSYPQAFHAIRGLADRPDSRVSFVATSRRALYDIEHKADSSSLSLSGIFHKIHLSCFSHDELEVLLGRRRRSD